MIIEKYWLAFNILEKIRPNQTPIKPKSSEKWNESIEYNSGSSNEEIKPL